MTRLIKKSASDKKFSGKKNAEKPVFFFITNFRSLFFEEEDVSKNLKLKNAEKLQVSHRQDDKVVKSPVQQAA